MLILSLSNCTHDNAVAVSEDYRILGAVQKERVTRVKGDGGRLCTIGFHRATIDEALEAADVRLKDIDVVVSTRGFFPTSYFKNSPIVRIKNAIKALRNKHRGVSLMATRFRKARSTDLASVFQTSKFMRDLGVPESAAFSTCNHHFAHALSALFFTDWDDALIYTADGGGDGLYYSTHHLCNGELKTIRGGDTYMMNLDSSKGSVGQAYGMMTEALGYKRNRHEGKLTGLAAYGKPTIHAAMRERFSVEDDGRIQGSFQNSQEMVSFIKGLAEGVKPEDAAASIQSLLEDVVLESIRRHLGATGARRVGLAGGVFANVKLNQRIAEENDVDEIFVFPGMGDDGLAVGGVLQFLLERDGIDGWLANRRRLDSVCWGRNYDSSAAALFEAQADKVGDDAAKDAARLLGDGAIVAIYAGRMEFGPRALGARSILASPCDAGINDTLNQRLARTEFMPFAPYVLEEDATEVFDISGHNRYAAGFMTVTCSVHEKWREKIPAVVHVDGTARPQVIRDGDHPLYAAILRAFKQKTGIPVLVNTSFNAHEEPIVNKPEECLKALEDGRVDYVALESGVYRRRKR